MDILLKLSSFMVPKRSTDILTYYLMELNNENLIETLIFGSIWLQLIVWKLRM